MRELSAIKHSGRCRRIVRYLPYSFIIIATFVYLKISGCLLDFWYPRLSQLGGQIDGFPRLTVEESIGGTFGSIQPNCQVPNESITYLWKTISNDSLRHFHHTAFRQMALIGGEADVELISSYLNSNRRIHIAKDALIIDAITWALAHMSIRGVYGAEKLLRKMCFHKYWIDLDTMLSADDRDTITHLDTRVIVAVEHYAILNREDFNDLLSNTLHNFSQGERRMRA